MITEGLNSPAINSLDSVIIKDATVSAYQSSFGVIDGNGLISMTNSRLYAGKNRGFEIIDTESGLNTSGTGTVRILNGSLTVEEGPVFYVTNTKASIKMDQTTVKNKADLLVAEASSYGLAGRNGGEGCGNRFQPRFCTADSGRYSSNLPRLPVSGTRFMV